MDICEFPDICGTFPAAVTVKLDKFDHALQQFGREERARLSRTLRGVESDSDTDRIVLPTSIRLASGEQHKTMCVIEDAPIYPLGKFALLRFEANSVTRRWLTQTSCPFSPSELRFYLLVWDPASNNSSCFGNNAVVQHVAYVHENRCDMFAEAQGWNNRPYELVAQHQLLNKHFGAA